MRLLPGLFGVEFTDEDVDDMFFLTKMDENKDGKKCRLVSLNVSSFNKRMFVFLNLLLCALLNSVFYAVALNGVECLSLKVYPLKPYVQAFKTLNRQCFNIGLDIL